MGFPIHRLRRLRRTPQMREMVRETRLSVKDLIYPLFVVHGKGIRREVSSMPGVYQQSIDGIVETCKEVLDLGIPAVLLFGIPAHKDPRGSEAYHEEGIVQQTVRAIKEACPDLVVITDVCLCEYTDHGHCGVVQEGEVLNDPTLELLAWEAVSHARAGADIVAPSDMMDGRVGFIRKALDETGFSHVPILSYAAKFASSLYGPFREAAESTPRFGDRRSYQMSPTNLREALREVALDVEEGADLIMVKPAMLFLDVIREVRRRWDLPLVAYHVSGEYAMIKAAARMGWLDEERVMWEALTAIKRAGADLIITYYAREVARALQAGFEGAF